ncbi:MAG: SLBB domain-containing protein [Nitrospira sp.]|jgi:polysaccharide export outer membrane protein|nr:SLBB domain-containing protein [Nitrospira sp. BO4]
MRWLRREPVAIGVVAMGVVLLLTGCRNPGQSTLPPSAVGTIPYSLPPLPKGDVYADETVPTAETPIETGDTLEVVIRRGAGEEKFSSLIRENGSVSVGFMEVAVGGLTVAEAEQRVQEAAKPFMRDPRVQIALKKKLLKVKRVFVFGDVRKPGVVPMARNMTVLQALAAADNFQETALLEEIRVVRGGDFTKPRILTADVARLFTYGDLSRNISLEENDVVFVPREHLGDATEAAKKIMPIIQVAIMPIYPAYLIPAFTTRP